MEMSKYFASEADNVQQRYMAADAIPYRDASGADYFNADDFYATGAPAAQAEAPATISKPIILNIQNTSTSTATASLFGANYNMFGNTGALTNFGNPASIIVTPALSTLTYGQILLNSQNLPMHIGIIYVQTTSGTGVLTNPISIVYLDNIGRNRTDPTFPKFDPYQQQNGIIEHQVSFTLDGNVSVQFTVPSSVTYQFSFYPQTTWVNSRIVTGGNPLTTLGRPDITKLATLPTLSQR